MSTHPRISDEVFGSALADIQFSTLIMSALLDDPEGLLSERCDAKLPSVQLRFGMEASLDLADVLESA